MVLVGYSSSDAESVLLFSVLTVKPSKGELGSFKPSSRDSGFEELLSRESGVDKRAAVASALYWPVVLAFSSARTVGGKREA